MAMVSAVETRPGTNPDRASFTTALEAARDQLIAAAGICPEGPADLTGVIGRAVLATLLPARRPRYSARKVKCATSRYLSRDDGRPHTVTTITEISVTIATPPPPGPTSKRRPHRRTGTARPSAADPPPAASPRSSPASHHRDWSGHELALMLGVKPRNMLTQLREWALLGFFTHTGFGTYALNTPPSPGILDKRTRPLTTRHCLATLRALHLDTDLPRQDLGTYRKDGPSSPRPFLGSARRTETESGGIATSVSRRRVGTGGHPALRR